MKQVHWVWGALLGAFCFGCSGSDDGGGASSPPLTCAPKQLRVQGSIDDMPVDISATADSFFFANKISADPGSLHVLVPGGLFDLEFDKLTPYGGNSAARGVVQASDTGLSVGNCETSGFPSSMHISDDGNTIAFTLVQLAHVPYCNATPARGQLQGCFATEP